MHQHVFKPHQHVNQTFSANERQRKQWRSVVAGFYWLLIGKCTGALIISIQWREFSRENVANLVGNITL